MPNVGQLICAWNSFAINTVELKQRTTKRKTKTKRNATELCIRFNESKRDQTFASYRTYIMCYIYSMYVQNELLHVCKMCIFSDHVLVSSEVIELMTSHDSQSCSQY